MIKTIDSNGYLVAKSHRILEHMFILHSPVIKLVCVGPCETSS